jgi:hypothetical protein
MTRSAELYTANLRNRIGQQFTFMPGRQPYPLRAAFTLTTHVCSAAVHLVISPDIGGNATIEIPDKLTTRALPATHHHTP